MDNGTSKIISATEIVNKRIRYPLSLFIDFDSGLNGLDFLEVIVEGDNTILSPLIDA